MLICPNCSSEIASSDSGEIKCECGALLGVDAKTQKRIDGVLNMGIAGVPFLVLALMGPGIFVKSSRVSPAIMLIPIIVLCGVLYLVRCVVRSRFLTVRIVYMPREGACTNCGQDCGDRLVPMGNRKLCPSCKDEYAQKIKEGCDG